MIINGKIYLDYNATTPVLPEAAGAANDAMLQTWGNPGSSHLAGKEAVTLFETAKIDVASLINASPEEIVFTSGGTESNNMALAGTAGAMKYKGRHIITSEIEHPAILMPCRRLQDAGYKVTRIKVNSSGVVNPEDVEAAIGHSTILVSVMLANNETGAIQPLQTIGKICKKRGVIFHTDAAQAVGKIPVDVQKLGVDLLSIAGHKLYAPKGIGVLYVRNGTNITPLFAGGGQQDGIRPGTEPVPLAAALGTACKTAMRDMNNETKRLNALREELYKMLKAKINEIYRYSNEAETLPNTLCISFPGIAGSEVLKRADSIMASTGAACHSGITDISHVIKAMGIPERIGMGTIRLSIGRFTDRQQVKAAALALTKSLL